MTGQQDKNLDRLWDQVQADNDVRAFRNEGRPVEVKAGAWEAELVEVENFFQDYRFPTAGIDLGPHRITNVEKYVRFNVEVARDKNGNQTYRPYLNRVIELMNHLRNR